MQCQQKLSAAMLQCHQCEELVDHIMVSSCCLDVCCESCQDQVQCHPEIRWVVPQTNVVDQSAAWSSLHAVHRAWRRYKPMFKLAHQSRKRYRSQFRQLTRSYITRLKKIIRLSHQGIHVDQSLIHFLSWSVTDYVDITKINIEAEFISACGTNQLELIDALLNLGSTDVHAHNDGALRWASEKGHIAVVNRLLEVGANVNARDDEALRRASMNGHLAVVNRLLEAGADVHAWDDQALREASENGHVEVVNRLVEAGADVHAMDDYALIWASANGHLAVANRLLEAGANVHAENDYALQLASSRGHLAVVERLLEAGADVHGRKYVTKVIRSPIG